MAATIKDVARRAGVSPSSVCRALADPGQVRPETRERVETAARDLGYYPNRAARGLITGRTGNVGVILPDLANPFFPSVVKAIQTQARRWDYAVLLSDTDEDPALEAPLIRALAKQVDGFLLCSPRAGDDELRAFAGQTPIVVLNRRVAPFPSVTADNADGMRQAVDHLYALGHRRVAYVAGPRASWSNRERLHGLRAATAASTGKATTSRATGSKATGSKATGGRAAVYAGLQLVEVGNVAPTVEGGAAAADLVIASAATAVLAYNDLVALGLLNQFGKRGIAVPGRISVIGFDDILLAGLVSPGLTTVAIDKEKIGRFGLDLLTGDTPRVSRIVPTQLIVRGSTGPR